VSQSLGQVLPLLESKRTSRWSGGRGLRGSRAPVTWGQIQVQAIGREAPAAVPAATTHHRLSILKADNLFGSLISLHHPPGFRGHDESRSRQIDLKLALRTPHSGVTVTRLTVTNLPSPMGFAELVVIGVNQEGGDVESDPSKPGESSSHSSVTHETVLAPTAMGWTCIGLRLSLVVDLRVVFEPT
jgi:hypothetical protein